MIGVSSLTDRKAPPPRAGGQETGQGNARQTCQAKALSPFIRIRRKREDHFMLARRQGDGPGSSILAENGDLAGIAVRPGLGMAFRSVAGASSLVPASIVADPGRT